VLENPGRDIGGNSKKYGTQKGPIKDDESSWWHNHNRQKLYILQTRNIL
jgi:hypothetical protein